MQPFDDLMVDSLVPNASGRHYGKRVLVVDDEALNLALMAEVCAGVGLDVATAGSGEEAIEALRRDGERDLLITDIRMGGMTGLELAALANAECTAMRILVVTGFAAEYFSDAPNGEGRVPWPVLCKPFDLSDFEGAIDGILAPGAA